MNIGGLTAELLAAGWVRSDLPADHVPECGMWPGYCVNKARWTDAYGHKPMCSVHAGQMMRQARHIEPRSGHEAQR